MKLPSYSKNQVEFLPLYIRCFNAQGLVNKFLLLHDFLSSVHVDIVSISETWITVLADSSLESPVSVSFSQFARFLSASLGRSHVF
jgi:hypothetical protein